MFLVPIKGFNDREQGEGMRIGNKAKEWIPLIEKKMIIHTDIENPGTK